MSTQELEQKVRELREMQAIVEEAQAEVEALKDAIKAAMGPAGGAAGRGVQNHLESGYHLPPGYSRTPQGHAGRGAGFHHPEHHPPLHRGIRKALAPASKQDTRATHVGSWTLYHGPFLFARGSGTV